MGSKKITVMAVGGAGCRVIREFAGSFESAGFHLLAVDSDVTSLAGTQLGEEHWIQAGRLLRSGRGCGGDLIAGQQALANERKQLHNVLSDTDVLIVVAGLGGGLATGGLPVVLGVAAKLHITTAVLVTLPFSMEGIRRRRLAEDKIKNDILPIADAVIVLPNDLLFSTLDGETAINDAFILSDKEMARTLRAVASILGGGNLFNADFASFTGVLKRRHTLCALGTALVEAGDDAYSRAMEKLLASPLLGGPESLDTADAVAFSLLGGPELSLGSARAVLDLCARQCDPDLGKIIVMGAATSEEFTGKLQLTALTVRYLDRPSPVTSVSGKRTSGANKAVEYDNEPGTQMDLPNLIVEDKGIMENTTPVMLDGEDLDVPTFKRRGIVVDCGK